MDVFWVLFLFFSIFVQCVNCATTAPPAEVGSKEVGYRCKLCMDVITTYRLAYPCDLKGALDFGALSDCSVSGHCNHFRGLHQDTVSVAFLMRSTLIFFLKVLYDEGCISADSLSFEENKTKCTGRGCSISDMYRDIQVQARIPGS